MNIPVALTKLAQLSSDDVNIPEATFNDATVENVLQIVFATAGAVAVIIIMIAGLKYVLSMGDPQSTAKAKNTILYALIGLVVCIMAFAIVTFVLDAL
ncbi:MAG: pilin [Candidatus Saccharibacteria bacterium]|nr:pilin [Candidatus Saccharibacteria bacterium]